MNDNLLEGVIPEQLGHLTSLRRVDLSHNRISGNYITLHYFIIMLLLLLLGLISV